MAQKQTPQETDQKTKDKAELAVKFATGLIDNWEKATRTRFNMIREWEENYLGKIRPRTSGRSNFPVPVLGRYIDEIHSRLDETPSLKFDSRVSVSRKLIARKATAIIADLKKPQNGNWDKYDRQSKRNAEFAGYNAMDFFSETVDGHFQLRAEPLHHTEFVFEVGGGNNLEKHAGVGRFPLWRTRSQLQSRVASGLYAKDQVEKLVNKYNDSDFKRNLTFFQTRIEHLKALGIDVDNNSYAGQPVYPLAQIQMTMDFGDGEERYLLTFDYMSGVWVRFKKLSEVYPSGMYSIDLWQTADDEEVTCKSPCDDIFPFAEGIRVKVNQLFDNHTKKIYGQTVYDPNFFPDPTQLIWRNADQLTKGIAYGGKPIASGFSQIKTDDMTSSTLEFVKYMDEFLTSVVGINPNDVTKEVQKVGILFGQLQKTAARLGSKNKSYNEMWQRNGRRALYELKAYLKEPQAIQIIGTRGVEWESFVGSELEDPADFDILIEGSNIELEMDEARKKSQGEVMDIIIKDPDLKKELNPRATVEFLLKGKGQFKDDEASRLMDKENYGSEEMMARADLACEQIIKGKTPELYYGADVAFLEYIQRFADKLDESEHDKKIALIKYGQAHRKFVMRNMAQKGMEQLAKNGIPPSQIKTPLPQGMGPQAPQGPPGGAPGVPMPSPQVHQRVQARGAKPVGHMPLPPNMKTLQPRQPSPQPPAPVGAGL